eukprot:TRINITY_DN7696_c0_g1_i1.p1 TRINITY_DN7696_c0_g1~~TRINITY_DN7696_c0_g1_i1.p1  ORF type:complete len:505 (-),score=74.46 TRINITY_DN7696_c0_g1_i1:163-1677(-)
MDEQRLMDYVRLVSNKRVLEVSADFLIDGKLTKSQFMRTFQAPRHVVDKLFELYDDDGNGVLDHKEFLLAMQDLDNGRAHSTCDICKELMWKWYECDECLEAFQICSSCYCQKHSHPHEFHFVKNYKEKECADLPKQTGLFLAKEINAMMQEYDFDNSGTICTLEGLLSNSPSVFFPAVEFLFTYFQFLYQFGYIESQLEWVSQMLKMCQFGDSSIYSRIRLSGDEQLKTEYVIKQYTCLFALFLVKKEVSNENIITEATVKSLVNIIRKQIDVHLGVVTEIILGQEKLANQLVQNQFLNHKQSMLVDVILFSVAVNCDWSGEFSEDEVDLYFEILKGAIKVKQNRLKIELDISSFSRSVVNQLKVPKSVEQWFQQHNIDMRLRQQAGTQLSAYLMQVSSEEDVQQLHEEYLQFEQQKNNQDKNDGKYKQQGMDDSVSQMFFIDTQKDDKIDDIWKSVAQGKGGDEFMQDIETVEQDQGETGVQEQDVEEEEQSVGELKLIEDE